MATIVGPPSTPYEGGVFKIDIYLPDLYPYVPPVIKFLTKVWHPNIGSQNGVVSLNALKGDWTSAMNLTTTLISLQALLSAPEPRDPQDDVVALQYLNNYDKFIQKAKRWTAQYANIQDDDLDPPSQHNVQDYNAADPTHAAPPPQHSVQDHNAALPTQQNVPDDNAAPPPPHRRRITQIPTLLVYATKMADNRGEINDQRVQRELGRIVNDQSLVGISFELDENNLRHLTVTMKGPVCTPYVGGTFKIDINLPDAYPFAPPHVRFITKIWHPNVSLQNGETRMSMLSAWSTTMGLKAVIIGLQALLAEPDLSEPLDDVVVSHYRASQAAFIRNAQYYTRTYAMERDTQPQVSTRASGTRVSRIPKHLKDYLL
ncbi:hypothetical protein QVD17_31688 [Tagetes erecta]|uniref:UBC core domain-containing protein n=1 Tax=Tagetes erecta TaxID=13708 RepID=A0AAD8KAC3_TARER|nr:hypothetical protein QVD17_31688 [Tagetes erecta]